MTISHKSAVRRLKIFGLDRSDSVAIINLINNWIVCNGPEWTISRLKQLKIDYLHHLSGKTPKWSWIKTRHNIPTGPLRRIFGLNKPQKILSALMIYSDLVSPKLTNKQWKKFHSSVDQSYIKVPTMWGYGSKPIISRRPLEFVMRMNTFENGLGKKGKRSPSWSADGEPIDSNALNSLLSFQHKYAREFVTRIIREDDTRINSFIRTAIYSKYRSITSFHNLKRHDDFVGRISFIQEPGFKLRAVAMPFESFQMLLEPLKKDLLEILHDIQEDFTHDQENGVEYIQSMLQDRKLSSIDLSDATNNLPFDNQLEMLETIYGPSHPLIELFKKVSRGRWYVSGPVKDISWTKGQPLGLGPSFGSFALFHHLVARAAISMVEQSTDPVDNLYHTIIGKGQDVRYPYAILGDDIAIDSKYQDAYLSLMDHYQVPISYDKCMFESDTAEFCSRFITKDKILRQYKWKSVNDNSFLDFAKRLGPKSISLFKPKQQYILKRIGYIPDTLGGPVGWNPQGIPLWEREEMFWQLAELLSSDTKVARSVPREELHYRLKVELQMLNAFRQWTPLCRPSSDDTMNTSVLRGEHGSSRQRIIKELDFQREDTVHNRCVVGVQATYFIFKDEIDRFLTEEERKIFNMIIDPSNSMNRKTNSWDSIHVQRLYSLLRSNDV